jgi:hypothetical protein
MNTRPSVELLFSKDMPVSLCSVEIHDGHHNENWVCTLTQQALCVIWGGHHREIRS